MLSATTGALKQERPVMLGSSFWPAEGLGAVVGDALNASVVYAGTALMKMAFLMTTCYLVMPPLLE